MLGLQPAVRREGCKSAPFDLLCIALYLENKPVCVYPLADLYWGVAQDKDTPLQSYWSGTGPSFEG